MQVTQEVWVRAHVACRSRTPTTPCVSTCNSPSARPVLHAPLKRRAVGGFLRELTPHPATPRALPRAVRGGQQVCGWGLQSPPPTAHPSLREHVVIPPRPCDTQTPSADVRLAVYPVQGQRGLGSHQRTRPAPLSPPSAPHRLSGTPTPHPLARIHERRSAASVGGGDVLEGRGGR